MIGECVPLFGRKEVEERRANDAAVTNDDGRRIGGRICDDRKRTAESRQQVRQGLTRRNARSHGARPPGPLDPSMDVPDLRI